MFDKRFTKFLAAIISGIILLSSAAYGEEFYRISPKGVTASFYLPYGIISDNDENLYITDSGNHRIQKLDSTGNKILSWGAYGTSDGYFNTPKGIAMDNEGNICIVDSGNNRIQKFTSSGEWIRTWGGFGKENGKFSNPTGIAIDADGNIYVTDTGNKRVQKLDSNGNWKASFTGATGIDDFMCPTGISVDKDGNVFIADLGSQSVYQIDASGKGEMLWKGKNDGALDSQIGLSGKLFITDSYSRTVKSVDFSGEERIKLVIDGAKDEKLVKPCGFAVGKSGKMYITDLGTNNIEIFDGDGNWKTRVGICGNEKGEFYSPKGLAVDYKGDIYVADEKNQRIQKISYDGTWLQSIDKVRIRGDHYGLTFTMVPISVAVNNEGHIYVLDSENLMVHKFGKDGYLIRSWGSKGSNQSQFISPRAIAVDSQGCVYVTDSENNCIQKFSGDGNFLAKYGDSGAEYRQFKGISGIAIDKKGFIYVADTENNRIQKLNPDGSWNALIGDFGSENGRFIAPEGIAIDINGCIYVCDTGNDRIQKFKPDGKWQETFGGSGSDNSKFHCPTGIAIGNHGQMYVTDTGNNRVQSMMYTGVNGDFNRNGSCESSDLTDVQSSVYQIKDFLENNDVDFIAGDVNGDWVVDITDIGYIRRSLAGNCSLSDLYKVDLATKKFTVDISIPDVKGIPGNEILVPVTITGIPKDGLVNFGYSLKYDSKFFYAKSGIYYIADGVGGFVNTQNSGNIIRYFDNSDNPIKEKEVTNIILQIKDTTLPGEYSFELEPLGIGSEVDGYVFSGEPKINIGKVIVESKEVETTSMPEIVTPTEPTSTSTPTPMPTPTSTPTPTPMLTPTSTSTSTPTLTPTPTPTPTLTPTPTPTQTTAPTTISSNTSVTNKGGNSSGGGSSNLTSIKVTQTLTPTPTVTLTATPKVISTATPTATPTVIVEPTPEYALSYPFVDIKGHWAEKNILKLAEIGAIAGYKDGTIRPDKFIARNEAVVIFARTLGLKPDYEPELDFKDADSIPSWVKPYLGPTLGYAIIRGYSDNTFKGEKNLSRAEAITLIVKSLSILNKKGFDLNPQSKNSISKGLSQYNDMKNSHWAKDSFEIAINNNIISGYPDNTLRPNNNVTRAEFCAMISVFLEE